MGRVCGSITARIEAIEDDTGLLTGLHVGSTISGDYEYESSSRDIGSGSNTGTYRFDTGPSHITLEAAGFTFRTDPTLPSMEIQVWNDHPAPAAGDYLTMYGHNGQFSVSVPPDPSFPEAIDNPKRTILLQLRDPSGTALTNDRLPRRVTLADWSGGGELTIYNANPMMARYLIKATLTAWVPAACP